ncbi:hypothetical protein Tco_1382756, partial [Tanacetum coccineum]
MSDNDARDQASEFETKVLVDSKQDDAKVVKVVRVANEQNSDVPNVLEGNGVIVVGVNENNKGVDKEVKHSIYTLHVLILFLKLLNDKYIKKKKMKAAIQKSRSNSTTLGEAFSLAGAMKARFTDEPVDEAVFVKVSDEMKGFNIAKQAIDVESTSNNDAQDQASELEMMVLVDGKQDDMKVVKVIGVADEQNSDEPYMLE